MTDAQKKAREIAEELDNKHLLANFSGYPFEELAVSIIAQHIEGLMKEIDFRTKRGLHLWAKDTMAITELGKERDALRARVEELEGRYRKLVKDNAPPPPPNETYIPGTTLEMI